MRVGDGVRVCVGHGVGVGVGWGWEADAGGGGVAYLGICEVWQQHLADAGFHATFWALKEAQTYPSAGAFLRTLQRSGASYAEGHKPFTRRNLEDIVAAYNSSYASACGGVYATYSTISCLAEPAVQ